MGQPAAKQGDQVLATDTHIVMVPAVPSPLPTPPGTAFQTSPSVPYASANPLHVTRHAHQ